MIGFVLKITAEVKMEYHGDVKHPSLTATLKMYTNLKGFGEAISDGPDIDLPADPKTLSADADTKKKEEKALLRNKLALANFTMSFQTVALMDHVKSQSVYIPKNIMSIGDNACMAS